MHSRARVAASLVIAAVALSCERTQQPASPDLSIALGKSHEPSNPCVADRDLDRKTASVEILCGVQVAGNPLISVAKGWFVDATNAYYVDDQSNRGVDAIDLRSYTWVGRIPGFVGAATGASGGAITYGGGTATSNGQGPNSMVPVDDHRMWVSDGNSQVAIVNLHSLTVESWISTAAPQCDGGTATTHFCGRVNEMTYDPDDQIILVENPNPLDEAFCTTAGNNCASTAAISFPTASPQKTLASYATFISARHPYRVLGRIWFADVKGTTEAPVWDHETHRFLLPVPTCSGATGATACTASAGGTQYVAVINPRIFSEHHFRELTWTQATMPSFAIPDCAHLMPGITPGTGMINDMAINERDQTVIMEVCGKGELVFNAHNGDVVNVVTEISSTDESWFNPGDRRFYVVATAPGGATPGNANTTSLGVIDGRTGLWLQNVLDVGGKIPAASDFPQNRALTTVTVPVGVDPTRDSTACVGFGFKGTGCVTVFEHEDDKQSNWGW
ncbi:MAG TPA: hypothetical protein VLV45_06815 [Gemmatimonadales bacterium]|nr:hypothetical protein [Gemmatimonadales bacterium]